MVPLIILYALVIIMLTAHVKLHRKKLALNRRLHQGTPCLMRAFRQQVAAQCKKKQTGPNIMLTVQGPPFHVYLANASIIAISVDRATFSRIII